MNYPKQPPFIILISNTKPRVVSRITAHRPISSLPPTRAEKHASFLSSSLGLSNPAETAASLPQTHLAQPSHGDGRTCNWIGPLCWQRVAFNQNSSNGWGNCNSVSLKNHLWRFFSIVKALKGKREVNSVNPWNKGQDGHHSPLYAYSLWSVLRC